MIKTKSEIMEVLKTLIGDNTSEQVLTALEDISDTMDDLENKTKDQTDWKQKYEQNNADWAKKYRDRFFSGEPAPKEDSEPTPDNEEKQLTYENLFKEEVK